MRIRIGKSPPRKSRLNTSQWIDGFEVWRDCGKWHALKWPRVMEASTKGAIVKMISEK